MTAVGPPQPRVSRRLGAAALVVDLLAVGLLVGAAVAAYSRDLVVLFLLVPPSALLALVGAVLSGSVLLRVVRLKKALGVLAVVLVTLATLPVGTAVLALAASATPNPAAAAAAPLARVVEQAGGHHLCDTGDPGLGPDNTQPWYTAVYDAPEGVDLRPRLLREAARQRDVVSDDPTLDLQRRSTARVSIDAGAPRVEGACGYGSTIVAASGRQLVRLDVWLPFRDPSAG